jgi:hypothetical protein
MDAHVTMLDLPWVHPGIHALIAADPSSLISEQQGAGVGKWKDFRYAGRTWARFDDADGCTDVTRLECRSGGTLVDRRRRSQLVL